MIVNFNTSEYNQYITSYLADESNEPYITSISEAEYLCRQHLDSGRSAQSPS